MKMLHLIIDAQPVLHTFSPVEVVNAIMQACKDVGEVPVDIYETEVK